MKWKGMFALAFVTVILAATLVVRHSRQQLARLEAAPSPVDSVQSIEPTNGRPELAPAKMERTKKTLPPKANPRTVSPTPVESLVATNKLERLAGIREIFRSLAAGDPGAALHDAKKISNATERETALLALVTEWTRGDLRPPRERARAIDLYGLEAGLGMELAKNPDLAILWAKEMTEGAGRGALIQQTAITMVDSDPAAAFALSEQVSESDQGKFLDAVFAGWAEKDTGAALQWAEQLADPSEQAAAIQAIRSVAPVGIGAALGIQDGYPVINQVLPGTPAETSGQIHSGDRILGLAQGDNAFLDVHGVPLKNIVDMIRGAPGTVLQLQVLPADAPPGSQPQIVSITRDQLKFKR